MKVFLAADHGGFDLKNNLIDFLQGLNYEVEDLGNYQKQDDDDYPDFIIPLAQKVVEEKTFGIVIGRSGNGEAIAANKVKGARAALCMTEKMAQKAREDNDANILSLAADYLETDLAKKITRTFLETKFSLAEKHQRRINKITSYESS